MTIMTKAEPIDLDLETLSLIELSQDKKHETMRRLYNHIMANPDPGIDAIIKYGAISTSIAYLQGMQNTLNWLRGATENPLKVDDLANKVMPSLDEIFDYIEDFEKRLPYAN